MNAPPVQPGDILAGKYRVDRLLGAGGMGVVVAATHLDLLEPRALKFMLPTALDNQEAVERFLREARAAARLKSEHVAKVHDVGRLETGSPYMVMEYLEGADLNTLLKQRGALSLQEAALYLLQACEALAEAHAAGIVHRDLKPANLFLTRRPDGTPTIKVLDFGISKITGRAAGNEYEMTKTDTILGSPLYMAPEQMRSARHADARSDIWSLGVVLYKLTTGALPFQAENITALVALILLETPRPPTQLRPDLPPALDSIISKCLQRDPLARYQNVAELAAALAPFAPPSAASYLERISLLVATSTASRRGPYASSATYPAPSAGPTPAPAYTADRTAAAWGNTSSRTKTRSRAPLAIAILAGTATLALLTVVGISLLRAPASASDIAPAAIAPTTEPTPVTPAPPPPPPTIASAVAPVPSASAEAPPPVSAVPSAEPQPVAPPKLSVTATANPAPRPKAPAATKPTQTDPFGDARK